MARTPTKPPIMSRMIDEDGNLTPIWQRWFVDFHSATTTNQAATNAAVTAVTPPAVAPASSGTHVMYRPTTSTGNGYDSPTAAYDNNATTPATAEVKDIETISRTWLGFSALQGTASAIVLNVLSDVSGIAAPPQRSDVITNGSHTIALTQQETDSETQPAGGATAKVEYTLDAGRTWNAYTAAVNLPLSQRIQDVQVRATATGTVAGAKLTHKINEIWIEVTP